MSTLPLAAGPLAEDTPMPASVRPARIIILRHAEKQDHSSLCPMGARRAQALAEQYLGRNAQPSLFAQGEQPAAMLAMTPHTIETITPSAQSWPLSVVSYADPDEDAATQAAAHDVLTDANYDGKIVVMTWEHKHIAKHHLQMTLSNLLGLNAIADIPKSWSDSNYDFFWIIDFARGSLVPTGFRMIKQAFATPFENLPSNDWDTPEPLHEQAGCLP
jgi:hypothetical protein